MSRPTPPALTVRYDGSTRTFAPGSDVVVGRDLRADVRIAHPLISRAHLVLRFDQGRWIAIDNGSLNGLFVNNRRVPAVDITDGLAVNIGNPDGPRLIFEVGRHQGAAGRTPTQAVPIATGQRPARPYGPPSGPYRPPTQPAAPPPPRYPSAPQPASRPGSYPPPTARQAPPRPPLDSPDLESATVMGPTAAPRSGDGNIATSMLKILRPGARPADNIPGAIKIGRATDNDIVVPDVLASRHHATLVPTPAGTEIRDNRSINGTFVNGARVDSALLREGDTVTIGNIDLVFSGGTLVRRTETEAATRTGGLEVRGLTWTIEGNKTLLDNISIDARPGTLTAVIGPSGAGKSTFAKQVAGLTHPTSGRVTFEGHDIHAEYASLRSRIGMVPQDDVVHGQLTVRQALMYAAELRLPPDTTKADREQVVMQVLEELEMTKHLDTRVEKLSGGQRKRASVALELLTGPSLLILDEPTSGLDPALDRQVMTMLRQLADAGRVVLVVTHSLTYLDVCDQVLLLAPGGKTAFYGPPSQIGPELGTTNWADIFSTVAGDPEAAHQRFMSRHGPPPPPPATEQPSDLGSPTSTSVRRQFSTIARRQVRLVISDRAYFAFLMFLPFIMGILSLSVPGDVGFGVPVPAIEGGAAPNEPGQILVMLNVGAVFMGTALTIRALIGERAIFRREQAVGLSTTAYLLAKVFVFTAFAIVQSAIVTSIAIAGKGWGKGAVETGAFLSSRSLELFIDIAATTIAAAMVGLALSALAKSNEQTMPLLVVAIMSQLVFSGGMIPVTDRIVLDQLSWLTPARWGFAASASTIDLIRLVPGPLTPHDRHWEHTAGTWWFDMAMLAVISIGYTLFVRWRIRLASS
ncbi:multidrug ABC transporter ATPase [Mycolicibacterium phlei]|jgi:ABC-type multidrug transport system ATPase subunit|uniref:ABC transporter ATP-binding protein n=2 Tax=Mycolicibacterium phlei TaxID=1771 RepID=A0A5N5V7Q7_MYCPH|nr:FHA domain-containing protein [Mycolicibacterium phlei]VEG08428.1 multidrug ABC transporter ATPase [Mycobacteroides chelonae]AMO60308.1 ABC transporter ATP-binding/permease protein [Mycolicibacterium phlei]EID17808.1 multidrug ABC transporter ATPase [Mycolicibacterium phlei RIVM601174]KAB7756650.1 ABC transporter ATP-binding protein [Mycolicibacterium phlei DSM 43239 = CCUG 21000]KXW63537.1 ABC transporter ATP-binding protein [Mycolicibacterium phlei DSM 43239 = CCUG 21000]